jgi:Fe-S-cluster containining protein
LNARDPRNLCLACGLCCNGVLFADVKLQPGDDALRLGSLGLKVAGGKFRQPCVAWEGCRCRIYSDRPKYCREFECLLFKRVRAGEVPFGSALDVVELARSKAEQVTLLLRQLGDLDESLSMRKRFLRTARRLETGAVEREEAAIYSELTIAFHELDKILRESFYDG